MFPDTIIHRSHTHTQTHGTAGVSFAYSTRAVRCQAHHPLSAFPTHTCWSRSGGSWGARISVRAQFLSQFPVTRAVESGERASERAPEIDYGRADHERSGALIPLRDTFVCARCACAERRRRLPLTGCTRLTGRLASIDAWPRILIGHMR